MSLLSEITTGPLAAELAPHIASGNDAAIADVLNRRDIPALGAVDRATFAMWVGATGLRAAIQDHADAVGSPLRSVSLTLLDCLQGGVANSLDMSSAQHQMMLGAWVQTGAISQAQHDELLALASHTISRAEQAGLGTVSVNDVARTVRADDGSSLV